MKAILLAVTLALFVAGCQPSEQTVGATVLGVSEIETGEVHDDSGKHDEPLLVPEVAWQVDVRLDDGNIATVIHQGSRRYAPGERVRLLVGDEGALLL